ncbi:chitin biosynthesis protein CHS5 [Blumeria hordei DH14]|uniref:Chitin biosynthesis protein CHS5 n=1 Tax=Blumeria graminis f. sp. hordei (strain DH14) TaxID=546991 RepID=N1JR27_BLUG1|nr:chitin biosynthesis protein CHS5 [Blumeria hordei DH14]
MLISLTVGKVDAGVAVLLTQDKRLIEFPSILLPPNISSGSIVDITVSRNFITEQKSEATFLALQDSIYESFGKDEPVAPVLRCRNATQTSVVLEWDPIMLATADIISLSLFRNGQKAGNIPKPEVMTSTKISGLGIDTEYTFHLVLRTTAGTYSSDRVVVRTHKMTDLSGITVTAGVLPAQLRDSLSRAVERIGAKMADSVRIDTTHFVTTEGHGAAWEKAVEMNIPVVRPEWVEGCERGGRIVGVRQYYLDADPRQRQISSADISMPTQESSRDLSLPSPPVEDHAAETAQSQPPTPPPKTDAEYNGKKDQSEDREQENSPTSPSNLPGRGEKSNPAERRSTTSAPLSESDDGQKPYQLADPGLSTPENSSFQDVAL